ncbi:hypothetical protein V7201_22460 [Bacillus sp. JJ1122]|uniref:hypothetical protein n=1 Tax=Bacillus sp. JJ1122 TaxID=3122951 RepID=UPI00300072A2
MKNKDLVMSVLLNAFLGYLWILFIDHIVVVANSLDNFFVGGLIIIGGTTLFWEIVKRVTPLNEYQNRHFVKIAGFVSFGIVVAVNLFVFNLI